MATATKSESAVIAGFSFSKPTTFTNEGQVTLEVPAAQLEDGVTGGTLTTRSTATAGVITIADGHSVLASETVDLVWAGGERYGVDIDSVDATKITFSGGAGDDLPDSTTAITVGRIISTIMAFDGDDADIFALNSASSGAMTVTFIDSGDAVLASYRLTSSNSYTFIWDTGVGTANPLTGNAVASVDISCDGTATDAKIAVLQNGV